MQVCHTEKKKAGGTFPLAEIRKRRAELLGSRSSVNSLSLDLGGLWVLQLPGLVHVHEEVLQQALSLHQVVCIHLLVHQGQVFVIALGVL